MEEDPIFSDRRVSCHKKEVLSCVPQVLAICLYWRFFLCGPFLAFVKISSPFGGEGKKRQKTMAIVPLTSLLEGAVGS